MRNKLLLDTETPCYLRQITTISLPFNVCGYLTGLFYGDNVAIARSHSSVILCWIFPYRLKSRFPTEEVLTAFHSDQRKA